MKKWKRVLAFSLALAMSAALAGCGGSSAADTSAEQTMEESEETVDDVNETEAESAEVAVDEEQANLSSGVLASKIGELDGDVVFSENPSLYASSAGRTMVSSNGVTLEDVSFVMIYNPLIYDEYAEENETSSLTTIESTLSSGSIGDQIITGIDRAGGLGEDENEQLPRISQKDVNEGLELVDQMGEIDRAGGMDPAYSTGDKHSFYYGSGLTRTQGEFTCAGVGDSCYIWTLNSNDAAADQISLLISEFDSNVYPKDLEAFGTPRFTENGGKINILLYPMQAGLCGFFAMADIFTTDEAAYYYGGTDLYKLNADHAIININSDYIEAYPTLVYSTLAHELQHQICASNLFSYNWPPMMRTWLNEAMSAYAEELTYEGIKFESGDADAFYLSNNVRTGQSLYNFFSGHRVETGNETTNYDTGCYGAVFLFTQYVNTMLEDVVYDDIHSFWRSVMENIDEPNALISSFSANTVAQIDSAYQYSALTSSKFATPEDEWMSKLTLDFYLETLNMDLARLNEYENEARACMLYSDFAPVSIEGGGRVIVAVPGSFTIPADAASDLIYIGLDENFNVVTDLITVQ